MKKTLMFIMLLMLAFRSQTNAQTGSLLLDNQTCYDVYVTMIAVAPSATYKCPAPLQSKQVYVPARSTRFFSSFCAFQTSGLAGWLLPSGASVPCSATDFAWQDARVVPATAITCPTGVPCSGSCPAPPCGPASVTASIGGVGCLSFPTPSSAACGFIVDILYTPGATNPKNALVKIY